VRSLHVLEPSPLMQARSIQIVARTEERLRAQVPTDAVARGIQTEIAVIEESDIAKAIRQEAERFGAHLVCIGSHGRSLSLAASRRAFWRRARVRCWSSEGHHHDCPRDRRLAWVARRGSRAPARIERGTASAKRSHCPLARCGPNQVTRGPRLSSPLLSRVTHGRRFLAA
jgi:Universal stress protein family